MAMTPFYRTALEITRVIRLSLLRVKYIGTENLPEKGGYVIACNHRTWFDPVILGHGVKRQVFFMGKAEIFDNWFLRLFCGGLGVFPVDRGTNDTTSIDHALELLANGQFLGVFPEGTRSHTAVPLKPKAGVALLIKTAKVGVVPCAISFKGKMRLWKKVEITYGKPMSYQDLFESTDKMPTLKKVTNVIMGDIISMLDLEEPEVNENNNS